MGVVHKLKPEIVDFIVQQKKDNPQLSCRKVVVVVIQTFNIKLSKSSINEIWKDSSLSSPIGRRATDSKAKTFKIPTEKRKQLFAGDSGHKDASVSPVHASPKPSKLSNPVVRSSSGSPQRSAAKMPASGPFEGLGAIFIKIAEWDLGKSSLLGQAMSKSLKGYDVALVEQWARVLLLMPLFGLEDLNQLSTYQGKGLWGMSGIKKSFDFHQIQQAIESIVDFKELQLNLLIELEQANQWVGGIKMSNENGEHFWLDNGCKGVLSNIVQYTHLNILQNVMTNFSSQFIANVQSVILQNVFYTNFQDNSHMNQQGDLFGETFGLFLAAMEAVPGRRLKNISLYSLSAEELVNFDTLPDKKRIFIGALWPWQKEFQHFLISEDANSRSGSIFIEELGKDCVYYESFLPVENLPGLTHYVDRRYKLRSFLLKDSLSAAPLAAVITNASSDEMDARQVLSMYLLRWPNLMSQSTKLEDMSAVMKTRLEEIYTADLSQPIDTNIVINKELVLMDFVQTLRKVFLRYCQWQYFPETVRTLSVDEFQNCFCSLSGYMSQTPQRIFIKLVTSPNYPYQRDLSLAIQRINEGNIVDPEGRRLLLSI